MDVTVWFRGLPDDGKNSSVKNDKSAVHFAMPLMSSGLFVDMKTLSLETAPTLGLSAKRDDLLAAGVTKEPSVSQPMESGVNPAATATADPLDKPPGFFRARHL